MRTPLVYITIDIPDAGFLTAEGERVTPYTSPAPMARLVTYGDHWLYPMEFQNYVKEVKSDLGKALIAQNLRIKHVAKSWLRGNQLIIVYRTEPSVIYLPNLTNKGNT